MEFSKEQKKAVTHGTGPMLVLAGPGSGKTAVIIHRVRYLTEQLGVPEDKILVISFTKTAAEEMEQRYQGLIGRRGQSRVAFSTFHAFFFKILREAAGYTTASIIKESEKYAILRDVLYRLYPKRVFEADMMTSILSEISRYKRRVPKKKAHRVSLFFKEGGFRGAQGGEASELEAFEPRVEPQLLFSVVAEYERRVRAARQLDFDDMQLLCYELLCSDPRVLSHWRERISHILIDEYQDIDPLQYELVRMLAGTEANLFVVGDDDQSIYAFRGAAPQLVSKFLHEYPKAERVVLAKNYRSCVSVTRAASQLIRKNHHRMQKDFSNHDTAEGVFQVERFPDRATEYQRLIALIRSSHRPLSQQAVLFRTNHQPGGLVLLCNRHNLPIRLQGRSTDLWQHWMTQDIAAYFRLASGKRERKDFLRILNRPMRFLPRELFRKPVIQKEELFSELLGRSDLQEIVRKLFFDLEMLERMNPIAGINYIRRAVGYEEYLISHAREQGIDRLELLEQLEEITETTRTAERYEEWEQQMLDLHSLAAQDMRNGRGRATVCEGYERSGVGQSLEALNLMTFHASKGLEFPVVYLIDLNEGIVPHRRAKTEAELEEERRALYVAMTRAKEELYLFYIEKRGGRELLPSRFLRDLT